MNVSKSEDATQMSSLLQKWRSDTPAADAGRIHLNNAGAALMPTPVVKAIEDHLKREVALGGYEAGDAAETEINETYEALASLIGTQARNIAVVENATGPTTSTICSTSARATWPTTGCRGSGSSR